MLKKYKSQKFSIIMINIELRAATHQRIGSVNNHDGSATRIENGARGGLPASGARLFERPVSLRLAPAGKSFAKEGELICA
jgi:hypothetical protein